MITGKIIYFLLSFTAFMSLSPFLVHSLLLYHSFLFMCPIGIPLLFPPLFSSTLKQSTRHRPCVSLYLYLLPSFLLYYSPIVETTGWGFPDRGRNWVIIYMFQIQFLIVLLLIKAANYLIQGFFFQSCT
jgi:hypothetical protein